MKIAIFTNNYLPNPYGVSMSIESFKIEFEKLGHTVYIFAPYTKGYVEKNANVFRFPSFDVNYKISFPLAIPFSSRIDKILDKLDIDIIHSQHPNLLGWSAKKWAKKKNVPLVFTWHTLFDKYAHFVPLIPKALAARWAIGNAVRYANVCDQVIAPTKSVEKIIQDWGVYPHTKKSKIIFWRNFLSKFIGLKISHIDAEDVGVGVKNKNIAVILSGVDEKEFENADSAIVRKKYGITENEKIAFIIGRLTAEKNVAFLMRAMSIALKQKPDLKFMISGEGWDVPIMQKIAEENKVEKQTIFTGLIHREERKNYFAAADFFVYSSKSETQGMILTEAHYMGLPIVAVYATGVKDIVRNNETGLLTRENEEEFANAAVKLAEDEELRKRFSENAKKIAKENYTASASAEKMLEVYGEAIKRKKEEAGFLERNSKS
jgi:1,2-diacylglycerol 3-alpha-glucosyltransferase